MIINQNLEKITNPNHYNGSTAMDNKSRKAHTIEIIESFSLKVRPILEFR